jgi:hypothetical protein
MEIVPTHDELVLAISEGRSEAYLTVVKPIFEALCGNMWAGVQDFNKDDFMKYGPFTENSQIGLPHDWGCRVQPAFFDVVVRSFLNSAPSGSRGQCKKWFPKTRTAKTTTPSAYFATGFRHALPVRLCLQPVFKYDVFLTIRTPNACSRVNKFVRDCLGLLRCVNGF